LSPAGAGSLLCPRLRRLQHAPQRQAQVLSHLVDVLSIVRRVGELAVDEAHARRDQQVLRHHALDQREHMRHRYVADQPLRDGVLQRRLPHLHAGFGEIARVHRFVLVGEQVVQVDTQCRGVVAEEIDAAVDQVVQVVAGAGEVGALLDSDELHLPAVLPFEHGAIDRVFVRIVIQQRRPADPHRGRDVVQRRGAVALA
jgi:hypothetical protein